MRLLGRFLMAFALTAGGSSSVAYGQIFAPPAPGEQPLPRGPLFEAPLAIDPGEPIAPEPKIEVVTSPNTGMAKLESNLGSKHVSLAHLAAMSSDYMDVRYLANSQQPDDPGIWERTRESYLDQWARFKSDGAQFYWSDNLWRIGAAIASAAPLANSHADQGIRDWYQRQAGEGRNRGVDEFAKVGKQFGEYKYAVPAYLALSLTGHLFPEHARLSILGEFGDRSLRALAVGAPTIGVLQYGLGGGRPYTGDSEWHPFRHHNSASGHAFVGAVPFLTVASMTESRPLKVLLLAGSFWTGWTRIHNDDHYFSQVLLGWSIAYLATEAVSHTECERCRIQVVPLAMPDCTGLGVHIQY